MTLLALIAALQPAPPPVIPLCPGLTIVTAVSQPQGDYESIKRIESVTADGVRVRYSSYMPDPNHDYGSSTVPPAPWVPFTVYRHIRTSDLQTAGAYMQQFAPAGVPETVRGTTALGISRDVYNRIRNEGKSALTVYQTILPGLPVNEDGGTNMFGMEYRLPGELARVDPSPRMVSVLLNDRRVELPALHAKGKFLWEESEFFFLDDPANPISLRFTIGASKLQVVKITHACEAAELPSGKGGGGSGAGGGGGGGSASAEQALERALQETGRAEIYSIYFDFNRTTIREESEPTLKTIAAVMRKHPEWKLSVGGHTDDIGSDASNLDLSKRRAGAVVATLAAKQGIDASRFTSAGFGESRPVDTNDTLEGRARNRRVELIRLQ